MRASNQRIGSSPVSANAAAKLLTNRAEFFRAHHHKSASSRSHSSCSLRVAISNNLPVAKQFHGRLGHQGIPVGLRVAQRIAPRSEASISSLPAENAPRRRLTIRGWRAESWCPRACAHDCREGVILRVGVTLECFRIDDQQVLYFRAAAPYCAARLAVNVAVLDASDKPQRPATRANTAGPGTPFRGVRACGERLAMERL